MERQHGVLDVIVDRLRCDPQPRCPVVVDLLSQNCRQSVLPHPVRIGRRFLHAGQPALPVPWTGDGMGDLVDEDEDKTLSRECPLNLNRPCFEIATPMCPVEVVEDS